METTSFMVKIKVHMSDMLTRYIVIESIIYGRILYPLTK